MRALLLTFSWQELRQHPWRNAAAALAVMLGVALAFAVQLINASALSEFSSAVRAVNGESDIELRARGASFDEALYTRVAALPGVALASPVLELQAMLKGPASTSANGSSTNSERKSLRVLGIDALVIAAIAPGLMPRPHTTDPRFALFAPGTAFVNAAAQALQTEGQGPTLQVQSGMQMRSLQVGGTVAAGGGPLVVMDIGAAQDFFGLQGQLTRIDLRLQPGTNLDAFVQTLALPANVLVARPQDAAQRVQSLSRAYRVNLTVLALVALFTGAFLVFSVLSLSVAKRAQQFALLGVLGLTARQRLHLVLWESAVLGSVGSVLGIGLGTGLASAALQLMGGDLGGGYFAGVSPTLQWSSAAAVAYGLLGLLAALAGAWWPAQQAQRLPLAQSLKGLGSMAQGRGPAWLALILIAASAILAWLPPVFGLPLAAYAAVALLLVGGIVGLPALVGLLYQGAAQAASAWAHAGHAPAALLLLAVERARRVPASAAVAVSGVVAALSLAVALTVMVASFRDSMTQWLDVVLPADLYARTASSTQAGSTAYISPAQLEHIAALPGVARLQAGRSLNLQLDARLPAVALVARPLFAGSDARYSTSPAHLPLLGAPLAVPADHVPIYVSEAMQDLYAIAAGSSGPFYQLIALERPANNAQSASNLEARYFVAGVWRDYARQHGSIAIDLADYQRLSGDLRSNELMLWLREPGDTAAVEERIRKLLAVNSSNLEFASTSQLRATSLRIFDRSFAVTTWLQMVAIAMGLFGVAASFSAQVLARRKEFGLLAHLGLTRRQILWVVAGEGAAWTLLGALAGLALGLAVSVVLVKVVNPQSFHWSMELAAPWGRLLALSAAVMLAGTATAWLAGRAAAGRDAVLAVKEDW